MEYGSAPHRGASLQIPVVAILLDRGDGQEQAAVVGHVGHDHEVAHGKLRVGAGGS